MSTRCQIGIYIAKPKDLNKFEALLYKHCDGYPDTDQGIVAYLTFQATQVINRSNNFN